MHSWRDLQSARRRRGARLRADDVRVDPDRRAPRFHRPVRWPFRDARCLLIRMVNRRGVIFNRSLFKYPEITDVERAAAELDRGRSRPRAQRGRLHRIHRLPAEGRPCHGSAGSRTRQTSGSRGPKPKFVDYYLEQIPFRDGRAALRRAQVHRARPHAADRVPALPLFRQDRSRPEELCAARSRHSAHQPETFIQRSLH